MRRREFVTGIGAVSIWPRAAQAQQSVRRLAFVHSGIPASRLTESGGPFWVRRFYETLRGLGYVEGTNLVVERFSADGHPERFHRWRSSRRRAGDESRASRRQSYGGQH